MYVYYLRPLHEGLKIQATYCIHDRLHNDYSFKISLAGQTNFELLKCAVKVKMNGKFKQKFVTERLTTAYVMRLVFIISHFTSLEPV